MSSSITAKLDELMEQVAGACGDLVDRVTIDAAEVKPPRGKVSVWIRPPDVAWPYSGGESELSVQLVFVAGAPWSQAAALPLLLDAMDRLAASALPVTTAEPIGYQRGDATLAAYQITLNEI